MNTAYPTLPLLDGNSMPGYGFGCFNAFGEEMSHAIETALRVGYRYIDSASAYRNEDAVGKGLARSGLPREEIFLLSKVWPTEYSCFEDAVAKSLKDLQVEHLDCLLLHWPSTDEALRLRAYETALRLQEKGLFKSLGVSNFQTEQIDRLKDTFGSYPVINEIELHPAYQQRALCQYCRDRGIQVVAYSPLSRGAYTQHPQLTAIGQAYGKSANQVVLRWHVQKGIIPIPKSVKEERIRANLEIFNFTLTEEEMACIDALECNGRTGHDPYEFPL